MKALNGVLLGAALGSVLAGAGGACAEGLISHGIAHDAFFGIYATERNLVAVGAGGQYSTSSDGTQWQHTEIAPPDISLLAVSERGNDGLVVGQGGVIMRKSGNDWVKSETPSSERLLAVAQGDGGLAMAVGGFGTVLRSQDGGQSWQKLSIDWEGLIEQPYEPHVYNCHIDARGNIYIVGEFGMVARSSDGGDSWQALHVGEESLFGFALNKSGAGYAVGQSGIVISTRDGGETWSRLPSGSEAILLDVAIREDGAAVISGIREALKVSAGGLRIERLNRPEFLEDWYVDVAVFKRDFYLVGQQAQVVKVTL